MAGFPLTSLMTSLTVISDPYSVAALLQLLHALLQLTTDQTVMPARRGPLLCCSSVAAVACSVAAGSSARTPNLMELQRQSLHRIR
jgi:hypothetical protein